MFRKSCKCKTKICKCGKKKIGGGSLGNYDFEDKDVYCFSDIEGNMPTEISELMGFTRDKISNDSLIYVKETKKTQEDFQIQNKAFVFTGDLIDRGSYSIRNLWNINMLKYYNPDNLILVCGNRDLNKIRMYHECCIPYIENNILNNKDIDKNIDIYEIFNLLDTISDDNTNIFKHNSRDIAKIINIPNLINPYKDSDGTTITLNIVRQTYDENFEKSYRDNIYRIKDIYEYTLGSPNQIKFFKDELEILFKINFGFNDESFTDDNFKRNFNFDSKNYKKLLKFIAMMNMVMGKMWENDILPKCLRAYNGLYIRYLSYSEIIAVFRKKHNKLCFVSHAGLPYNHDDEENESGFYIPSNIGSNLLPATNNNIDDNIKLIKEINKDFKLDFISKINSFDYLKSIKYKKYVAMAATCGTIKISGSNTSEDIIEEEIISDASPVVSRLSEPDKYDKRDKSLIKLINNDKEILKIYNIYGHVPTGLLPTVRKKKDDNLISYHIGLDISKAENGLGISNKVSYVYLKITNDLDTLTGKTETNVPYDVIKMDDKDDKDLKKYETKQDKITINYSDYNIDTYFNDIKIVNYDNKENYLYTIDKITYYGLNGWNLIKYVPQQIGNGKKNKTYTKSDKRFMNGKRQMVIYLGKRGCEYVKTAGEYVSLTKFIKAINKNKK
jgi:hypothetical protein